MKTFPTNFYGKRNKAFIPDFPIYKKSDEEINSEIEEFMELIEEILASESFKKNARSKGILLTIKQFGTFSLQIQQRKYLNRLLKRYKVSTKNQIKA